MYVISFDKYPKISNSLPMTIDIGGSLYSHLLNSKQRIKSNPSRIHYPYVIGCKQNDHL